MRTINLPTIRQQKIVIIILLQLFINILLTNLIKLGSLFNKNINTTANVFLITNIIFALLSFYIIKNMVSLTKKEHELFLLKKEQIYIENLSLFLRELKHDLNNQIFVVNGFMQLGKVEEAAAYAEELSEQFDWMEALLKLNQPEFASLILNKMMEAKNQGVEVEVNIATDDISNIPKEILTRAVGNLLDNAVEAMKHNDTEPKQIVFEIYPKENYILVSVENTGEVPREIVENMFQKGFSTKKDKIDHGLGLHIVKSLMDSIGGKVTQENKEGATIFQLLFPLNSA